MSHQRPLFRRLFMPYVAIALATVLLLLYFIGAAFRRAELGHVEHSLDLRLQLVGRQLTEYVLEQDTFACRSLLREYAEVGSFRLTLIGPDGRPIGDSDTSAHALPNFANRIEVREALVGRVGYSIQFEGGLNRTEFALARPLRAGDQIVAVLRGSEPVAASRWEVLRRTSGLVSISLLMIGVGVLLVFYVVRRVTVPIETLRQGATRFAEGHLDARLEEPETTELASLSRALNHMAGQLDDRIRAVERQREEREAVLAAMLEGVLAVDSEGQVIMMNTAAARLFNVDRTRSQGRTIEEAVRNTDVQQFVHFTLAAGQTVEREIVRYENQERILQLRGTPILEEGRVAGVVVVINDITQMRRMETTRREFVANASHELRTPVTAIKGSIETLRDGALSNPADAERFLEMMSRQADYLQAIIEDLLSLARIEQASESAKLAVEDLTILPILYEALEATQATREARRQRVNIRCAEELRAPINGFLVRQAIVNLLDNACKYSPEQTEIEVRAVADRGTLVISVEDHGPGIAEKHLPRIFERFYRVDASRNRKYGGTGLGLAIVKHAALAHGGTADVDTQLGRGSTFSIRLPLTR
ncbi:MAG: HAMP domain-containing protein [bacterium]|nr:HAMP domain-containing protein [bacterium]